MKTPTFITNLLRRIRGESGTGTIVRKQALINTVVSRETRDINALVGAELNSITAFASAGLRQIDALVATGAVDAITGARLTKVRGLFGNAANAL